jgi:Arc/MetJ family transcription regulator
MRLTVNIDDELIARAREITGIQGDAALVEAGLKVLIVGGAGKRLAALGGTQPELPDVPRRRSV